MASVSSVTISVLLLLVTSTLSCVEAVNIEGYPTSSRCRSGNTFLCTNIASGDCCDFVQNNGPVLGIQFLNVRPGQWMSSWLAAATTGCGQRRELKENLHRAPRSSRCLNGNGQSMTGAKWHRTRPADFEILDSSSLNSTACKNIVKAREMTWNSTIQDWVEVLH